MRKANLMLHCGANRIDRKDLERVATPPATRTWHPIPHMDLLGQVEDHIKANSLRVVQESHAIARDGKRYFGLLQVTNGQAETDYATIFGVRNSHDQSFPGGLALGSQVFVCDNLAFSGEVQIARRHTRNMRRDLPGLIKSAVAQLGNMRRSQDDRIAAYKKHELTDEQAHDLILRGINDVRVLPTITLPAVVKQWREPAYEEFEQRTAWRLFNAFTEVLKERPLFKRPKSTEALHGLIDSACGLVA